MALEDVLERGNPQALAGRVLARFDFEPSPRYLEETKIPPNFLDGSLIYFGSFMSAERSATVLFLQNLGMDERSANDWTETLMREPTEFYGITQPYPMIPGVFRNGGYDLGYLGHFDLISSGKSLNAFFQEYAEAYYTQQTPPQLRVPVEMTGFPEFGPGERRRLIEFNTNQIGSLAHLVAHYAQTGDTEERQRMEIRLVSAALHNGFLPAVEELLAYARQGDLNGIVHTVADAEEELRAAAQMKLERSVGR